MGCQVSIFPLIWFQCDGASWQLFTGVVPAHGVAMDTSLPWPEVLRPPANLQGTSSQAHLLAMSLMLSELILVYHHFLETLNQEMDKKRTKRTYAN